MNENVKCVLLYKEIAQRIDYLTMHRKPCTISEANRVTVNLEEGCSSWCRERKKDMERLKAFCRGCENLKEIRLNMLDVEALQIVAENCDKLSCIKFNQSESALEATLEQARVKTHYKYKSMTDNDGLKELLQQLLCNYRPNVELKEVGFCRWLDCKYNDYIC